MARVRQRRGSSCSILQVALFVIIACMVVIPLWHGTWIPAASVRAGSGKFNLVESEASKSPVGWLSMEALTDSQLRHLVEVQNGTISKLARIVDALHDREMSPEHLAMPARDLPTGITPELAKSWCTAINSVVIKIGHCPYPHA